MNDTRRWGATVALMMGATMVVTTPAFADAASSAAAYDRASQRFEAGDLRAARVELLNALKENQNNAAARLLYARVLLARGDGVAAQTEIERAIRAGAPKASTLHLTANALILQRQFSRALDTARAAAVPPQFASYAARMRGRAHAALRADTPARAEFERAARLGPSNPDNHVDLARYYASKREVPAAVASVDRALALSNRNVPALLLKGDLVRATQGLEPSLAFFNRALAVDPNNIEALLERAATLGDLRREAPARADIEKVKGLAPDHPLALYLEAVLAARAGKYQDAQALLGRTKGILDRYPPAQLLQGMVSFQLGNFGQASEAFTRVVAAAPGNPIGLRLLGMTQLRRGDARGALATLRPLEARPNLDAGTLSLLGSAYARTGDYAKAQTFLERASALAPGRQTQLDTQIAMTRAAQGDIGGAEAGLQQVLREDPNSLQALVSLSAVKLRERDFRAAGLTAERIVKAHPQLPIGYNLRGAAQLGLRNTKAAEANFRTALQRKPDYADARRSLAQLLLVTNRVEEGRKELGVLIQQQPNDVRTMMLLAGVAASRNNLAERVDWLRRAAIAAPQAFEPRAALVQTYAAAQQPNRALTEATALARTNGRDPRALQLLAAAQLQARQPAASVATLNRLVAQQPQSKAARVLLARAQTLSNSPAQARSTLEAALRLPGPGTEQVYVDLIALDLRARRFDDALATAARLRAATPRKLAAEKLIGDVNLAANRPAAALAVYRRVRAQSDTTQTATLVATAQFRSGDRAGALATLEEQARRNPRDPLARAALADFHLQTRNWRAAVATYEAMRRAGGAAANDPGILNNLAWAYNQIGDRRAIALAAEAHKRAPRAAVIQDTYGLILVNTGTNPKQGLALLQQAVRATPRNPNMRFNLAQAYRANNQRAEAVREVTAALRMPGLENPARARQFLQQLGG